MPTPKPLTEAELDRLIARIPSIADRASLYSHLSIVKAWNISEKMPAAPAPAPVVREKIVEKIVAAEPPTAEIVAWIRKEWPTATVRAKMAQKIADLIEEGAWRNK